MTVFIGDHQETPEEGEEKNPEDISIISPEPKSEDDFETDWT